jgi:hypothetical protein
MPDLSQKEEVRDIFKESLISVDDKLPINGLQQSSFFCDLPEKGIAKNRETRQLKKLAHQRCGYSIIESTWIFNDRIIGDIA